MQDVSLYVIMVIGVYERFFYLRFFSEILRNLYFKTVSL